MVKNSSLSRSARQFDFFSKGISFQVDGRDSYGSIFGTFTSLIIVLVIATYGIHKFLIMLNYEDTNFNEFSVQNELSLKEFNNDELQFQIAFSAWD